MQQVQDHLAQNTTLTDEQAKKIADANGITPSLVHEYVAKDRAAGQAQQQLRDFATKQAHASVGGETQFNNLMQWAASSLSAEERNAINERHKSDPTAVMALTQELNQRYQTALGAGGSQPLASVGSQTGVSTVQPYASNTEMARDVADPRYQEKDPITQMPNPKYDPQFRAHVHARMLAMHRKEQAEAAQA